MRPLALLLGLGALSVAGPASALDPAKTPPITSREILTNKLQIQGSGSRIGAAALPAFNEANGALGRGVIFDSGGTLETPGTVTIPAGKQLDVMGWRETNIIAGSGSRASWLDFDLRTSGGSASTNLYGVIGALHNAGPGATKAIYGRAVADPGATGVVMGGVFGAETRSGVNTSNGIQITNDSADGTPVTAGIIIDSNSTDRTKLVPHQYGLLMSNLVAIPAGGAAVQAFAGGAGNFLTLKNATGSADLFTVNSLGAVSTSALTIGSGGTSVTPTTLTMQPQGTISLSNTNRQFQLQGLDAAGGAQERARILAAGIGDLVQVDVFQNLGVAGFTDRQGASKAILIPNGTCATAAPTGGGILCVEGGALKYRGSSGTLTTIAPP